ncbi:hypothetical protein CAPN002_09170 [Capnocytophaga stomatis]|uniref:Uncharacterized protein n=1 Tax=Capnocytophaga felis TaxID=2267611 RepID=A0A5M4B786_9FLAO|nr:MULTISPECIES: hypothetical protein [Capnocytophaga]GET45464.1 hypothetical protein RCZ01_07660 [Capnocytophaga felis]GET47373.1 hypothetical protein RCZ02_02040 [Capnocytophaga felis]GIJ93699.1 hypothetical protein CAPN002_09170 [Capnocytophaga stomatis]
MNIKEINPNTVVVTTSYVTQNQHPIVSVFYDEDGDLQVFSQEGADMEKVQLITFQQILTIDPSLLTIGNLNKGEQFYRDSPKEQWRKK